MSFEASENVAEIPKIPKKSSSSKIRAKERSLLEASEALPRVPGKKDSTNKDKGK